MAKQTARVPNSKPEKPQMPAAESGTAASAAESKPTSVSKSNTVLGITVTSVTAEMRRAMIAEAAYYLAQQRSFRTGSEMEDWLLAEKQIDATLSAQSHGT